MKLIPLMCVMAGCGVMLTSCASNSALTRVEMSSAGPSRRNSSIENEVLAEVNAFRRAKGLNELSRHSGLDRLARQHAEFMLRNQGKFGLHGGTATHYGFEERALAAQRMLNMATIGENVIAGQPGSGPIGGALVRGWRGSPKHLANMSEKWQVTGIGVAADDTGCVCATQLFGTPSLAQSRWAGPRLQY